MILYTILVFLRMDFVLGLRKTTRAYYSMFSLVDPVFNMAYFIPRLQQLMSHVVEVLFILEHMMLSWGRSIF